MLWQRSPSLSTPETAIMWIYIILMRSFSFDLTRYILETSADWNVRSYVLFSEIIWAYKTVFVEGIWGSSLHFYQLITSSLVFFWLFSLWRLSTRGNEQNILMRETRFDLKLNSHAPLFSFNSAEDGYSHSTHIFSHN